MAHQEIVANDVLGRLVDVGRPEPHHPNVLALKTRREFLDSGQNALRSVGGA